MEGYARSVGVDFGICWTGAVSIRWMDFIYERPWYVLVLDGLIEDGFSLSDVDPVVFMYEDVNGFSDQSIRLSDGGAEVMVGRIGGF